jgi:hypothetical protein
MAVTVGTITTAQNDAYSADKPVLLSKNLLEGTTGSATDVTGGSGPESISACWRSTKASSDHLPMSVSAATANSDPWQSPTRAFDRNIGSFTAPFLSDDAVGPTGTHSYYKHCFIARINTNTTDNPIDSIVIGSHNLNQIDVGSVTYPFLVTVHFSDVADFSSYQQVVQWNVTTRTNFINKRLVLLPSASYTNVSYIQIVFSVASGGGAVLPAPQIGEVFMGPRRQLSRRPDTESFDTDTTENVMGTFSSKGGVHSRYAISRGRAIRSPKFYPSGDPRLGTTDLYGLDDLQTFDTFWSDTDYGSKPFFYLPSPFTKADNAYFMYSERTEFPSAMLGGLTERELEYDLREVSPYLSSEV